MNYLQPHKRADSGRARVILLIIAIGICIYAAIRFFAPHFLPAVFTSVAEPFWRTEFAIGSGSLESPSQILADNERLKRALAEADIRIQAISAVETENAELKQILGRASTTAYVLAAVLRRPPASAPGELVIDIGRDHNLAVGDMVYAPGDILVGAVSDVLETTSKVSLFSSPGHKYEILIGSSHIPATATGRGGGQYHAQVPRDAKIVEGDSVIAPSINDLPFGFVTAVVADPAEPFEDVLFSSTVNIFSMRWVLIKKSR